MLSKRRKPIIQCGGLKLKTKEDLKYTAAKAYAKKKKKKKASDREKREGT